MTNDEAQEMREKLELQRAVLADFGLFAFRCDDLDKLLHRAAELVSTALGVSLVKVLEHLPERHEMLLRSGVNWQPGVVGHETFGDDERSPGGYALRSDRPVISKDVDAEDRFEIPDVLRRHGVRSMVNVIIAGQNDAFGVLEVDSQRLRDFSPDDVAFLQIYANLLAAAIERMRTHEELRRSAREQSVLARELAHRARNLLGLVRALASQTSTAERSADEYRTAFIGRLMALSVAEGLVFESGNDHADPSVLAQQVLAPYRMDDPGKITIEGEAVGLSPRQARMFGLALHELATNAVKYGALGAPHGRVRLHWSCLRDGVRRDLAVTWQEADGPEITQPDRRGFGSRLLQDVVTHELNGQAELRFYQQGLQYHLRFPIEDPK
jgi:two-component sensor histidine kinase